MRDDKSLPRDSVSPDSAGAQLRCLACGATFPRSAVTTPKKGQLACPDCGATDVENVPSPER